jgi:hypothetical protein
MPRATAKPTTKGCKRYFLIDLVKREMKPSCRMGTTAPEVVSRVCTAPCADAEVDEEEEGGTATTESLILPRSYDVCDVDYF